MYFTISHECKRLKWKINVKAAALVECCDERMAYHTERAEWWDGERKTAEDKLRSEGIQLRHFDVTGGQRMEAQLDAGLAKRVSECENKAKEHKAALGYFRAYKAMFSLSLPETEFDLIVDDVLYFNLNGADPDGGSAE